MTPLYNASINPRGSSSSYTSFVYEEPSDTLVTVELEDMPAIPTLSSQIYPVSYASGAPIKKTDIQPILTALNSRIATLEDVYVALGFGLNWCYPAYVQKSSSDTTIQIYAASQPGKCGASSGRQMIKVQVQDNSPPQFVFVFGPKPEEGQTIRVAGEELSIENFYQPVTGTSGFRNMYEAFATASTCYDVTNCPVPAVQTLVQQTTTGTSTIEPPKQITIPTLNVSPTTPFGSSSDGLFSASPSQPPVILVTATTTLQPVPSTEVVIPTQTTIAALQTAYTAPKAQGSSSSYYSTSQDRSETTAEPSTSTTPPTSTTSTPSKKSSPDSGAKSTAQTVVESKSTATESSKAKQGGVTTVQYVAKPGGGTITKSGEPAYYDPKAGFFANLIGEFAYDFNRVVKGVKVATT
jgi:hypothetical protein